MRLPDFIEANVEPIMDAWVTFALAREADTASNNLHALRDHAAEMLGVIVADLRHAQTPSEQQSKSEGTGPRGYADTAAELHGAGRAAQGFTAAEMVAEFRALRASVVRLYRAAHNTLSAEDQEDLLRFNEAVDQALEESVARFTKELDRSRDMLLAVLSHDLRTPLSTVLIATQHAVNGPSLDDENRSLMQRAVRSVKRMKQMIDDLHDFTRSRLGPDVAINRCETDLGAVLRDAVSEMDGLTSAHVFAMEVEGDLRGFWDGPRLSQVLANLLQNAVEHGDTTRPIVASAKGMSAEVVLAVYNHGPVIPAGELSGLFAPLKRFRNGVSSRSTVHNMGLGLYIAERIVHAHGGHIAVTSSSDDGTRFTVTLPR